MTVAAPRHRGGALCCSDRQTERLGSPSFVMVVGGQHHNDLGLSGRMQGDSAYRADRALRAAPHADFAVMAIRLQSLSRLRADGAARFACLQGKALRLSPPRMAWRPCIPRTGCAGSARPALMHATAHRLSSPQLPTPAVLAPEPARLVSGSCPHKPASAA